MRHWPMLVAIDSETALITEYCKAPALACVSWAGEQGRQGLLHHSEAKSFVANALEKHTIIGHNFAYDACVFAAAWPDLIPVIFKAYDAGRIVDTMLAQKLADIANGEHEHPRHMHNGAPYTLEALAWRHLKKQLDKSTWRLEYGKLRDLALRDWPEGARQYPVDDVTTTRQVWRAIVQKHGIEATGDCARQARHFFALQLVSCWGIRTDVELVARLRADTEAQIIKLAEELCAAGLLRRERHGLVRSVKMARERMAQVNPACERSAKGNVLCGAEQCEDSGDPLLEKYSQYASLAQRVSSQYPHLERGRIHSRYSLAETGRTRSGGNDNGKPGYNIQNLPRGEYGKLGERECFIPRPGSVFIDCDYSSLELHTAAQMCLDQYGFSEMGKALSVGVKVHDDFGGVLAGLPYEEMLRRADEPEIKGFRQTAKPCNFMLFGGGGQERLGGVAKKEYGIVKPFEWQRRDNGDLFRFYSFWDDARTKWRQRWHESLRHFAWAKSLTGTYSNPTPAKIKLLRVDRWAGGLFYNDVCNRPFQALGSDIAKDALYEVVRACYVEPGSPLYGSRVVGFYHDEILTESPEATAHEAAIEQTRIMNEVGARWCPAVPPKTSPELMRRWSKSAKPIWENGRLVPWEMST